MQKAFQHDLTSDSTSWSFHWTTIVSYKKTTPSNCKIPSNMTSLPIQHHDHSIEQPSVLQIHTPHTSKSVPSDATKIAYTHDSHDKTPLDLVLPLMKNRVLNEEDDSFNKDDSFNIDVLPKISIAKPVWSQLQIDKTPDLVLPWHDPNLQSNIIPAVDHIAWPIFSLGHSEAARLLDTTCTQRKLEFHNSNWPIVCHFFSSSDNNDAEYVPQVQLILCNHNISFNSSVVSESAFNYSKSSVLHLLTADIRRMLIQTWKHS